jgi:FMN-dependent NADH-azoreductase
MKLLHIDSAITGEHSISRQISRAVVDKCLQEHPDLEITYRDLGKDPIGHMTGAAFRALCGHAELPAECAEEFQEAQEILAEFSGADIMVFGIPMYNYSMSTNMRSYFDRLCLSSKTFRFTPQGHVGLLPDRPVIICSSRGSFYHEESPYGRWDHHEPYIRCLFDLMGITNLHFIHADGVALGEELRVSAITAAMQEATTRMHVG